MSRYRRANTPGATYFFTVVTYRRRWFLTEEQPRRWLREAIATTRRDHPFGIDAWVLMPDHLHCIWTLPAGDGDFSTRWALIKSRFTRFAKPHLHRPEWVTASKRRHREGTVWQRRFWEHQPGRVGTVYVPTRNAKTESSHVMEKPGRVGTTCVPTRN